jgi:transcriptional regulator with XRE-family HTH domain
METHEEQQPSERVDLTRSSDTVYDRRTVAKKVDKPAHSANKGGGDDGSPSFGESLRRQRELRKISLREVSEATKINIRYLEALERNDFTFLPGGAFTRGFIRAYARHIGIDEDEAINAYLYELHEQQSPEEASESEPRPGQDTFTRILHHYEIAAGTDDRRRKRARVLVVVVGLLAIAAVVAGIVWLVTSGVLGPTAAVVPAWWDAR